MHWKNYRVNQVAATNLLLGTYVLICTSTDNSLFLGKCAEIFNLREGTP